MQGAGPKHEVDRKDVDPKFKKQGGCSQSMQGAGSKHEVDRKDVDPKFRKQGG